MSVLIYGWKEIYDKRIVPSMSQKYNLQIFTEEKFCYGHVIYGIPYTIINDKCHISDENIALVEYAFNEYNAKYYNRDDDSEAELQEYIYGELSDEELLNLVYFFD